MLKNGLELIKKYLQIMHITLNFMCKDW